MADVSISNLEDDEENGKTKLIETKQTRWMACRIILGVGIFFGSFQAPWQALPVLLDRKIAADDGLPFTENQLVLSQTVIFVGWLVGSVLLHPLMQRLTIKQLLVFLASIMMLLSFATITLPYIPKVSLSMLFGVRLLHGICLNIQGVQYIYMQNCFPGYGSQLCSLVNALYSVVAVVMALICGTWALHSNWRLEAFLWFGLPILTGLLLAFPDLRSVLLSLPRALSPAIPAPTVPQSGHEGWDLTGTPRKDLRNLAVCFSATVFAYYGLSYSADSLCSNAYMSLMLVSVSDIVACLFASRASEIGRNRAQFGGFFLGGLCLMACAFGTTDSAFVMTMVFVARMCLSVVFVTIYVALAEVFPEWCQKIALPTCEIFGRVGGCLSPWCGTLPVHLSCPLFGLACLVAARATMKLPDKCAKLEQ